MINPTAMSTPGPTLGSPTVRTKGSSEKQRIPGPLGAVDKMNWNNLVIPNCKEAIIYYHLIRKLEAFKTTMIFKYV